MPFSPTAVYDLAAALLGAAEGALTANGIPLPDLRYVHNGEVALDCPLLVVSLERLALGQAGAEDVSPVKCARPRVATFAITLTRCVPGPSGNPPVLPTEAELEASGAELLEDAWVLLTGVTAAYSEGAFTDTCRTFSVTGLDPYGPRGTHGGSVLRVQAEL